MAELLKHVYSKKFIADLSSVFSKHTKHFDVEKFEPLVFGGGWDSLELKARMRRITESLQRCLTQDFEKDVKVLLDVAKSLREDVNRGFEYMLFPDFVERFGQEHFDLSVNALGKLTKLASSEFAVRPFILARPQQMMDRMFFWAKSTDEDVRRLASEGCRPRLPWAMALPIFKNKPTPILRILEQLKNDPSLYVRRSVANNLNDISKDHPAVVVNMAQRWLGNSDNTDWVVKHALRGLLKNAHPEALKLFGYGDISHINVCALKVDKSVSFGAYLPFSFELKTSTESIGNLRIEYAIDYMKANGKRARKIFKVSESNYQQPHKLFQRKHAFKAISTRKHYAGQHGFALLLNGTEVADQLFELTGL
ncbi:MAG: 3-methyladenine DNA glycosylase AlkC [Oceanicoccus sp.]|jgi:3-methyladenine DNA glycosylase AlkC